MQIDLDAKVETHDGKAAGNVKYAVIDPATKEVTAFVVSTGSLLGREVLVPRHDLERATPNGEVLRLDLSKDDLEHLPSFITVEYSPLPTGWWAPGLAYPLSGYLSPASYVPAATLREERQSVPHDITVTRGATIYDPAGHEVGVVEDVRFDAASGELTGLVARAGGALATAFGRGEVVEIERAEIDSVADEKVYLRVTREDLHRRFAEQHAAPPSR